MNKKEIADLIDQKSQLLNSLSDQIWDLAEIKFQEFTSSKLLADTLLKEGFTITNNISGIETAFQATFGSGKPVIGILGEYDALSEMSQKADVFHRESVPNQMHGHGCGHNMLGVGALGAALGIKEFLTATKLSGTIVYLGCPAEEGGAGKTFMARDGAFSSLDAALTWHPSDYNAVTFGSSLANSQISYKFHGISAHAASSPHLGRSALDAVELMNIGANFLREHIVPDARVHYAITNSGGTMPGIVQPYAEVLYVIRAPRMPQVRDITDRLHKIAQGAALMTETTVDIDFIKATSNLIPNNTLGELFYRNMQFLTPPLASQNKLLYSKNMQATMDSTYNSLEYLTSLSPQIAAEIKMHYNQPINDFLVPYKPTEITQPFSTDVGDVSWICPTAQIGTTTWTANSSEHTWQVVAQGKSSLAHAGTLYAAKVIAITAIDLYTNVSILEKAKCELKERLGGEPYISPIPLEVTL